MGACTSKASQSKSRDFRLRNDFLYSPLNDGTLPAPSNEDLDIVQFASPIVVADEGKHFQVHVMRLGKLEGQVRCHFRTEEASGKAGSRYEHVEGDLIFESGHFEQSIEIPILDSPMWSATLEFKVVLELPMSCRLGKYLNVCRVKVIDSDTFPSSNFQEEIALGNVEEIPRLGLFVEYVKLILEQPGNMWRFGITLLFDQLKNGYVWFTLVSSVYMVNVVFGHARSTQDLLIPDDPESTAQVIGSLYVLLPLVLHIWKVIKVRLDLTGRSKLYLQTSVMRKYMNFNDESRQAVSQPDVVAFVMQKSEDLAGGISEVSSLLETFGKLVMLNYFAVSSNPAMTWAVITMPCVMIMWSVVRDSGFICEKPEEPSKKLITNFVAEVSQNYSIIAHYFQRPAMNDKFAARALKFNDDLIPETVYKMNSEFFFNWLGPLFVGLYMAFYSPLVISKELPLGTFLATISVFKEVSSNFVDGYGGLKKVISCFEPLVDLTTFLNRKTDVPALQGFIDYRVAETLARRRELMATPSVEAEVRTDLIPIQLQDVSLTISERLSVGRNPIFSGLNLHVNQGKLVAVTGRAGSGKSQLLRLLAGDTAATSGKVLLPSHLRFAMVTHQVFVMGTTPLQNLFFGDPPAVAEAEERHRMLWILDKLQMVNTRQLVETEIALLQGQEEVEDNEPGTCGCCSEACDDPADPEDDFMRPQDGSQRARAINQKLAGWRNALSFQEKAKLHIARALIMNPEILILEKPLMNLDEAESEQVMTVLREFVSNRGVAMPPESLETRRPRTCFFSAERSTSTMIDAAWKFDGDHFVEVAPKGKEAKEEKDGKRAKMATRKSVSLNVAP